LVEKSTPLKPEFIDLIENARKRKGEKFKNQFFIFSICLIISVFLWALVKLSQNYFYTIEYRLSYTEIPGNLKLVRYSDSTLTVKIKLQGFELFSERFLKPADREFEVSLRNVRVKSNDLTPWGYLLTNRLGKEIAAQSDFQNDIFIVTPDTLYFEFEKQVIRRIPSHVGAGMIKSPALERDSLLHRKDSLNKVDPSKSYVKKRK
jgi:hypothetical protein